MTVTFEINSSAHQPFLSSGNRVAEHYTLPRLELIEKGNPKVLEGEDVIDDVTLTTYIVRYDLAVGFSEWRKTKRAERK